MYKFENNCIEINNKIYEFKYEIRTVLEYKCNYIVLLSIPFNISEINNIYCLDSQAKMLWQAEDLNSAYPDLKNVLPYEQMGIKPGYIFASDFYGRIFKINLANGKIEGFDIVR